MSAGEGLLSQANIHIQRQNDPSISIYTEKVGNLFFENANLKATFTDFRTTPNGIEYADNYSATFTDRSLVDKGYVDSKLGSSIIDLSQFTSTTQISMNTTGANSYDNEHQISLIRHLDGGNYVQYFVMGANSEDDFIDISTVTSNGASAIDVGGKKITFGHNGTQVFLDDNGLYYGASVNLTFTDPNAIINKQYVDNAISQINGGVSYATTQYVNDTINQSTSQFATQQYVSDTLTNYQPNYTNGVDIRTTSDSNIEYSSTQQINLFRGNPMDFNQSLTFGYSTGVGSDDYILFQNNSSPSTGGRWSNIWMGNKEIKLQNNNSQGIYGSTDSSFSVNDYGFSFATSNTLGSCGVSIDSASGITYSSFGGNYSSNTLVPKSYVDNLVSSIATFISSTSKPSPSTNSVIYWKNDAGDITLLVNVDGVEKGIVLTTI
jgi:hypothetical protein